MKIIQALIVLFAIIGCLALALGGFYVYSVSTGDGDNFLTKFKKARATAKADAAQTTAPVVAKNSEYASVIRQYQPTPTPAPVAVAPQPGAVVVAPGVAPVRVASAPPVRPVKTPKPDKGKIRSWPSGKKWVCLTYDDGPHPEWTPKILKLLTSKNVKATFFLQGDSIKRHPDVAAQIHRAGFEIGNHTMTHPDFNESKYTPEKIREQLEETNALIAEYAMKEPVRVMRPPYGNTPKKLEKICRDMGLQIVCWNIDTNDWRKDTTTDEMIKNIMNNLSDGSIILMHDKHEKTYDTTAAVIDKIREKGYQFVTVSELLGLVPLGPGPADAPTRAPAVRAAPAAATGQMVAPAPAAVSVQPAAIQAQPAAIPAGAAPVTGALPVPAAAQSTQAPTGATLDSSKITVPPGQK